MLFPSDKSNTKISHNLACSDFSCKKKTINTAANILTAIWINFPELNYTNYVTCNQNTSYRAHKTEYPKKCDAPRNMIHRDNSETLNNIRNTQKIVYTRKVQYLQSSVLFLFLLLWMAASCSGKMHVNLSIALCVISYSHSYRSNLENILISC